jgi:hypothetical protein
MGIVEAPPRVVTLSCLPVIQLIDVVVLGLNDVDVVRRNVSHGIGKLKNTEEEKHMQDHRRASRSEFETQAQEGTDGPEERQAEGMRRLRFREHLEHHSLHNDSHIPHQPPRHTAPGSIPDRMRRDCPPQDHVMHSLDQEHLAA